MLNFGCCCTPGHYLMGCPCAIPDNIYLHVAWHPPIDNVTFDYAHDATLTYQAKPSDLATYRIEAVGFFSGLIDTYGVSFGAVVSFYTYRYHFLCDGAGAYNLEFLTVPSSTFGYPQKSPMVSWVPGFVGSGNTCSPFSMKKPQVFNDGLSVFRQQGLVLDGIPGGPPAPAKVWIPPLPPGFGPS